MLTLVKILFFPISYTLYLMPRKGQVFLSNILGWIVCCIFKSRYDVVMENLEIAFPDKDLKWRKKIALESYQNMALNVFEYLILFHFKKEDFKKYFEDVNFKHVPQQLENKKGCFMLSLHLGAIHFALVGLSLGGYAHAATLKVRGFLMKDLVKDICLRFGVTAIADRDNPYDIFRMIKRNIPIAFIMDQYMGSPQGILVNFFGKPAGTAAGLAAFVSKTKMPVIPVYNFRRDDGKIVYAEAETPVFFEEKSTKQETIHYMTQKYNDSIEEIVRKYPGQWFWMHRRWKKFS